MLDLLNSIESEALAALPRAATPDSLESWRIAYLGPKGQLKSAMASLKDVPKDQKPAVGARLNAVQKSLTDAFESHRLALSAAPSASGAASGPLIDPTLPALLHSEAIGRSHIITRVRNELVEVFARLGFDVADGPELEDDQHNFVKLNIPPEHPARDPIDNFYVDRPGSVATPRMLRSQTSTVQIRVMEAAVKNGAGPPIKIVSPGRVYRPDTVDATHSFMFHQIEGLSLGRGVSMADLKTTLLQFARAYFGPDAQIRLRPSYFPFTEPSAEFDMMIALRPEQPPRWIELGGCGMVDPAVLTMCGIDPEIWTGFAFGFGIERLAMGKYKIPDIRMLYENDIRFLEQL